MRFDDARSRTVGTIFVIIFLGSLASSLRYCAETVSNVATLSKLSGYQRTVYTEDKYYKGKHAFGSASWLEDVLPPGRLVNIYDDGDYMYYHSRFNYYLYPRYVPVKENVELESNYGDMSFISRLPYGEYVFAVGIKPKAGKFTIKGKRYAVAARESDGDYLLRALK